ncbi:hypothetical protein [Gemmobacter sp. 24YEA27]|uniref:hypothetical protein n=1 Tax=Gemmobacter sp. 24YEA27 TaxID=3040672 RepID=UPI0024B33941|nr:hypothetical protein [Gemmobacter sp. 24YEA27]
MSEASLIKAKAGKQHKTFAAVHRHIPDDNQIGDLFSDGGRTREKAVRQEGRQAL